MKKALTILVMISWFLASPVHAQLPQLVLFAGINRQGENITVTYTVYSQSTDPVTMTLELLPPTGVIERAPVDYGANHVWFDHPTVVIAYYQVTNLAPTNHNLNFDAVVRDNLGNTAFASVAFFNPSLTSVYTIYVPLVTKSTN